MGLRSKVGWVLHCRDNTTRTLEALSADLRELQARVDRLTTAVERTQRTWEVELHDVRERQLDEFDRVREVVIAATDDLSERIAALHRAADGG
jgi:siroheme synthase (precorrin-2 oxidase/ferrochelatase)